MKRLFALAMILCLALTAACAETRERVVTIDGEEDLVQETLFRTDLGFSFWYDADWLAISEINYGVGIAISVDLIAGGDAEDDTYMELEPPEVIEMLPWEFLEEYRPGDVPQQFEILDSGAEMTWWIGPSAYAEGSVMGIYVVKDGEQWIGAYATWPEGYTDSWGARMTDLVRTVSFGGGEAPAVPAQSGAPVSAVWAREAMDTASTYLSWNLVGSDAWVMFRAEEGVTDFRIMELTMQFTGDGSYTFHESEAFALEGLWPAQPLIAGLDFPGDMPCWGIAYRDAQGAEHRCTVEISGENGAILLTEY
ncbi:MAG: hypothetical protein IKP10_02315 [Clostridia bacterium]|nr:hypothetical protein [Clostridia bacterium]